MTLDRLDTQILNLLQQDATVPLRTPSAHAAPGKLSGWSLQR